MDENQIEKEFLLELQKPSSSTAEDAALLRRLLMNEKSAPEILEYQENVLANLQHQVAAKNFSIEKALEHVQSAEGLFKIRLLQMDLDRVKYLVAEYLRTRLLKIQKYAYHTLTNEDIRPKLAPQELEFVSDFLTLQNEHMNKCCVSKLPASYNSLTDADMGASPDLNSFVFCRVEEDLDNMQDETGLVTMMAKGDQFALKYNSIRSYVASGQVTLL